LIERLSEKLDLASGQSISARDLLEAQRRVPRLAEDKNKTAPSEQAQGSLINGNNDNDDNDEELGTLFVDHTFYRHKIRKGFIQSQTFGTRARQACLL